MGATIAVSMTLFLGIFILLPALGRPRHRRRARARRLSRSTCSRVRWCSGSFSATCCAIGRMKEIRKVFQYHGAEHKAIAAYENDVPLTPESAQRFTTAHVRCGTNFLLTVLVDRDRRVLGDRPGRIPYLIASRIILIPIIAGVAYELIRWRRSTWTSAGSGR